MVRVTPVPQFPQEDYLCSIFLSKSNLLNISLDGTSNSKMTMGMIDLVSKIFIWFVVTG